jgi:hypothetical protein
MVSRSPLRERLEREFRARERAHRPAADPTTALRETVEAIWKIVEHAARESALDGSRHDIDAVLARRELVRCGTRELSAVIRRGVESGAFVRAVGHSALAIRPRRRRVRAVGVRALAAASAAGAGDGAGGA